MRSTTLPMDAFGKQAILQYAETQGIPASAAVGEAAAYYLADRDRGRPAWRVPRFAREVGEPAEGEEVPVELDDDIWEALELEARRQGVTPLMLLRHAVLYFLGRP